MSLIYPILLLFHVLSYYSDPSYLTLPYPTLSYPTLLHLALTYLALLCPTLLCPTLSFPIQHYFTLPYLTLSYPTLPYLTLPYLTLSYPTLPYLTLSYPTLHCLTLPFLYMFILSVEKLKNCPSVHVQDLPYTEGQPEGSKDDNALFLQCLYSLSRMDKQSKRNNQMDPTLPPVPPYSTLSTTSNVSVHYVFPPLWFHFLSSISICLYSSGENVRSLYLKMLKIGLINENLRAVDNLLGKLFKTEGRGVERTHSSGVTEGEIDRRSWSWLGSADSIIVEVMLMFYVKNYFT